ncbi:hypothetical protein POM88_043330 [Heracleum sosnowskyi]|uniref:TF-B3 domain-containing protein n=1 Tax=Heracleum sosnowskyi TaxID=360622 RepID=A0AAD8H3J1_9APIA|nr:hypothetical protein POM88_043330 [Heracleum sosnowskyi]
MEESNVRKVFLLNFPAKFCKTYMPKKDEDIILVDDKGRETVAKFLVKGNRLSGGWRGFARDHKLSNEDILIFHRIATAPHKLKVDINRKACSRTSTAAAAAADDDVADVRAAPDIADVRAPADAAVVRAAADATDVRAAADAADAADVRAAAEVLAYW